MPLGKEKTLQTLIRKVFLVEHRGVEPLTSTMRMSRATNCANAPNNMKFLKCGQRIAQAGVCPQNMGYYIRQIMNAQEEFCETQNIRSCA